MILNILTYLAASVAYAAPSPTPSLRPSAHPSAQPYVRPSQMKFAPLPKPKPLPIRKRGMKTTPVYPELAKPKR